MRMNELDKKELRPETIKASYVKVTTFFELTNKEYLDELTPDVAQKAFELLQQYPLNCKKRYPNLSAEEAIYANSKKKGPCLGVDTCDSYLKQASSIVRYAQEKGYIDSNPLEKLKVFRGKNYRLKVEADKYKPFTRSELEMIFNEDTYFKMRTDYDAPDFFIPLISLYQGMRCNEICQLLCSDIEIIDGIPAFSIKEEKGTQKRVKNVQSQRLIPIHPELIRLGFLKYVRRMQEKGEKRLFPTLKLDSKGYYSRKITRDFKNYIRHLGIDSPVKVFHSLRHNFSTRCAESGIAQTIVNRLGGWSGKTVGEGYVNEVEIPSLRKQLSKVRFPEVTCTPAFLEFCF